MRFHRYGRYEFKDTNRKRLAFARKQRNERAALPLFADQIAAEQIGVDEEMEQRRSGWTRRQSEERLARANAWRRARARLAAYPNPERQTLSAFWQRCPYPADPSYLLTMLHSYDQGRLNMNPVNPKMTEENRMTVRATIASLLAQKASSPATK